MPPGSVAGGGVELCHRDSVLFAAARWHTELVGTIGILLQALTRIKPALTPLAALGFVTIQILAIAFHVIHRGETEVMPVGTIALAIAALVVWGPNGKVSIRPRA